MLERNDDRQVMVEQVRRKASRQLRTGRRRNEALWFGLGTFGVIGWSVAVPTVLGAAIGVWLDSRVDGSRSWTLVLLLAGVGVGCLTAWLWLSRSRKDIERQREDETRD